MEEGKMEEGKSWKAEIEDILAKQALALNYEYGMTSRILPVVSEQGTHSVSLMLDLTHSSLDFDLELRVRFSDEPSQGLSWELEGPEGVGTLWEEVSRSRDEFRTAVHGLPYFVQGFFAGRASRQTAESGSSR